jgi:hypothetical protein
MAYNEFTLHGLTRLFGLHIESQPDAFAGAEPILLTALLRETLAESVPLALEVSTEKARSEFIIAPMLAEARRHFGGRISLFSGVEFNVDIEAGLRGICDFLLSLSPLQLFVQAPVIAVVEAKNENIKAGLGQCVAEMLAAQRFNAGRGTILPNVYGVVTTGSTWKFLRLTGLTVTVDETEYYIDKPEQIIGILVSMIQEAQDSLKNLQDSQESMVPL